MMKLKDVKNVIETLEVNDHLEIISYLNVWSNGSKVRRFCGQDEKSEWHNPKDGYRKMVAILVEVEE